eukprot:2998630-Alexandrium_andersonii.AAC.1
MLTHLAPAFGAHGGASADDPNRRVLHQYWCTIRGDRALEGEGAELRRATAARADPGASASVPGKPRPAPVENSLVLAS